MSGLDDEGIRLSYQFVGPNRTSQLQIRSVDPSPLAAIGQLLNELGAEGWELVSYDTTTHRGVLKRPRA
jgi:hypothetical protein